MPGNSIGKLFTVTTFGESHGPAYGCIVDGCPPGLLLNAEDIQQELNYRRPGASHFTSQRHEMDHVSILSGVFNGMTTGTPIGLLIANTDQRPRDYEKIKDQYRPGHADFTYQTKYGIRDYRGGGRASARETMMRVAAGAIAKKYLLEHFGTHIQAYLAQLGPILIGPIDLQQTRSNDFFCPDAQKIPELETYLTAIRRQGDSIGARINVIASHVPPGLGEPVFDRLHADLAHAFMSINAVKGVEFGAGFASIQQKGSEHRDALSPNGFLSNHAGGTLGGISTGQDITASIAFKPTSSIPQAIQSLNQENEPISVSVTGRHDPCVGLRAPPIVEAMMAIVLMDHVMRHRAQNIEKPIIGAM